MTEETALVKVETLDLDVLFTQDGMTDILDKIKKRAYEILPTHDLTTDKGRKEIASTAHKVARSKTLIDDIGKKRMEDAKKIVDETNGYRKQARDFLDDLKVEIRKPLTDWEAEEARIRQEKIKKEEERRAKIQADIESIKAHGLLDPFMTSDDIKSRLQALSKFKITEDDYGEFTEEAHNILGSVGQRIQEALDARLKFEEEQEKVRLENERLEKIRKEQAEAQAKIDAENTRIAEEKEKLIAQKKKARAERLYNTGLFYSENVGIFYFETIEYDAETLYTLSDEDFDKKIKTIINAIEAEKTRRKKEQEEKEAKIREDERQKEKEKQEQEAREQAEKEEAERKEVARLEALKPDKEKILDWLSYLRWQDVPDLSTKEMRDFIHEASAKIGRLIEQITKDVEAL